MITKIVAEIGINHNGDLNITKKLIDAAILSGCQYVKFQKRTVDDVYTKEELDKLRTSPFGTTNREQKMGLEFGEKEYDVIDSYCKEKGINWFGSPWDLKSVDFLMNYNPEYIKVASAMITNVHLLTRIKEKITGTNTKVIIATGMSTEEEIDKCLSILGNDNVSYILKCTSSYPTPQADMNMLEIESLKKLYGENRVGFSNHSSGIIYIIQAVIMKCPMIEYHITLDRSMYGSDQAASVELGGMLKIKDYIESIERGWGNGAICPQPSEIPIKEKLRKC